MNKIFSILLIFSLLLTGCATSNPVTPTPDPVDDKEIVDASKEKEIINEQKEKLKLETVSSTNKTETKEVDTTVYNFDDLTKKIEKMGYDLESDGYTLFPTESHFYPEYIKDEDELKTVYLTLDTVKNSGYKWYLYEDMMELESINSVSGMVSTADALSSKDSGIFHSFTASASMDSVLNAAPPSYGFISESFNTSEYKNVEESSFLNVSSSPLSTFAADVDTASYSNFRAVLRDKLSEDIRYEDESLHDIRIEEMLNYFNYNFNTESNENFSVSAEVSTTPWNPETQLLVLNVKAKELTAEQNTGSNLVFLVDTSGSMDNEDKLPLLKESLRLLVNELTENDTVSIVTYSGDSRVVVDGVSGADKEDILDAIRELVPYGSTNGEGGLKKAYEIAKKYQDKHSNSRIIMCSDGDLNVGMSSEEDLYEFVSDKKETGIYLSVLGFGLGNYKDNKMEVLADNGNGNYHYIDNIKEGHKVLVEEMMSTLLTIADDVKFQIEFNPNYIKAYRKIGYENRDMANEDFHDDTKDGGEVGYGHEITIVYEIVPANSQMELANTDLKYQETTTVNDVTDWLTLSIRYKDHGEKESQLLEFVVNEKNYTETPSEDWQFIANAVGFGQLINESEFTESLTYQDILNTLKELNLDEEKEEFFGLILGYIHYLEAIESIED